MRDLLILGTNPHSRDAVIFIDRINHISPTWNLLGFLTGEESDLGTTIEGLPVLGDAARLEQFPEAALLPGLGWPTTPPEIEDRFISIIDPSTVVCRSTHIGRGCLIYPNCFFGIGAVLGERGLVLAGCTINHDAQIADRVILTSGVQLAGYVQIETDCELGQGCTVRQRIHIGQGSFIGMGAVVVKDVPPNSVMVGNPARWLRSRQEK